jgi:hypothetical protein
MMQECVMFCFIYIYTGVSKLMSQTSPGYSPSLIKQKSSYQHGPKSEQIPRYHLRSCAGIL